MYTPWGKSDHQRKVTRGINFYSTPSHGGFKVSNGMLKKMNPILASIGMDGWFEEDCAWCAVYLAFPELFNPEHVKQAKDTLKNWWPLEYQEYYGVTLNPNESTTLQAIHHREVNKDNFVVRAAWGAWHEKVPSNFVGVLAEKETTKEKKYFLVPKWEYNTRDGNFVIDITKHKEVEPITGV